VLGSPHENPAAPKQDARLPVGRVIAAARGVPSARGLSVLNEHLGASAGDCSAIGRGSLEGTAQRDMLREVGRDATDGSHWSVGGEDLAAEVLVNWPTEGVRDGGWDGASRTGDKDDVGVDSHDVVSLPCDR
jgi:hypothetical protein